LALSFFGGDKGSQLNDILGQLGQVAPSQSSEPIDPSDTYAVFASKVIGSGNKLWKPVVESKGKKYLEPKLVLFRQGTQSACGGASSQIGPHYCPTDRTIYLDETFFEELQSKFGAKGGDVAEAYVIAHELGHHVQNELGISAMVRQEAADNPESANPLSVNQELQADCFAGVWAKSVEKIGVIKPGEIDEAVNAAQAVGDDRIQKRTSGQVNQELWTHGSSKDRAKWFNAGFDSGNPKNCDTF
jgi:uncharacterized protein